MKTKRYAKTQAEADQAINAPADAIRHVTAKMQTAIDEGHRSRHIDADDLIEILLAIADVLDPPL
tara:strand:+ start:916 stop:1110 length:195 start_codon:yes stop_codon:yes gene_type:complete